MIFNKAIHTIPGSPFPHFILPCSMFKKYLPVIALIAAAVFLFWVKQNQRGQLKPSSIEKPAGSIEASEPFNRQTGKIRYSKHARCRMDCRMIDESEVTEILEKGTINYDKIEESNKGKSYPLEGRTHDGQNVRIVFAPHENELVVVTVIDLDKEWQCNCN